MTDYAQIFAFLFLMLGPFKILGEFGKITKDADWVFTKKIAVYSIIFASIALLLAALLGENILRKFGIPLPIMAIAGGLILFLVALQNIIQQFSPTEPASEITAAPSLRMAMNPLAFPTIVTPYGIAAVIIFFTISPDLRSKLIMGGIIVCIMLINLVFMLTYKKIVKVLAVVLPILGAVLGIVQVSLGLMIIYNNLKTLLDIN